MENLKVVKCQYCNKEQVIQKPAQKTFQCCSKVQVIGKFTIVESEPLQNSIPAELKPEQTLEITETLEEPVQMDAKEQYHCPQCKQPVERFGDCTNPDCLAEIFWKE